jgi:predicted GIY-YIG superfamily endonuclease
MTYDFGTICAIAKVLGFPEVDDGRIKALLSEGRRVRWRYDDYQRLYVELIEDCLAQHLTWTDCEEAAMVFLVRQREDALNREITLKDRARNRAIRLLASDRFDEAEHQVIRAKEHAETAAMMRADIDAIKSRFPNADWDF